MERNHKNSLKKSRQQIVDDLDVNDVFDVLLQNDIFSDDIVERIKAETTRKDKARRLLDILPSRGPQAYPVFLEALRENYRWLVDTLENGDRDARNNTQEINNQITEVLMRGGVPHHPHLINRTKETTAVKQGLMELGCGRFLVLHGMPGSGKSVLAAESVRDPAIAVQHFPGGIFWVKIGTVQPEQLLGRIRALCTKLDAAILPNNIEEGQETLRKLFLSSEYSDSLLILDDVWKAEVVKTFNLPVRILITTQDVSIMNVVPGLFSIIELQPGFTEQQSLQLFSTYLKIPVNFLPPEAKEIHNESKGSPMVISMVASLLSETGRQAQTQRQSGRWTYYLHNLRNRRYSKITKQRSYEHESVMGAVAMSIDVLPPQQRSMYEKLAVFLDDDPIHSAALEVLWGVERYEVEDTMNKFIQKSLAMCEYDAVHECFLYSLHDLQLDYLKNRLSKEEETEMHRMFVDKYLDMVQGKFGDLPHDNYILTHLGYHLYKAEMFDLFSQVYLNLRYVEKVLKNCGTASILYDYRKYHDQISCESSGGQFEEDLLDFEDFCRTAGVIVSTGPCTDIVQLGLSESTASAVYTAAKILADTEHEYLYLEWKNRSSLHSQNIATILHPGKPSDIKFFPDARVVTSTEEGVIKVWDLTTGDVTQRLHGHYSPISCVSVEPGEGSGTHEINLCTGGEDGCIKTWRSSPLAPDDNVDNAALSVRRKSVRKHSPKLSGLEVLNEIFTSKNQVDESVSTIKNLSRYRIF
ncbi:apoptotic protease-activating factor 1 [Eurytemora carolleeae]|uniref:apoptotic protease-activating factor 1 n=1 Tax=Eurytemora carolleeae TaxID=1294199 RepID=UPI000C78AEB7|nr:apoptotic protease-activating factor 1 [Eurytemora carolleeae]|eukprot:XP_023327782.1 apoptotic protease-activating factor 1-like [Eurytemora affinis]